MHLKVTMRSSIIVLSILVFVTVAHALTQQENLSVYDVLEQYDFPVGLLPQGATGYELNEKTGKFTVYFDDTCIFGIQSYELKYKKTIKGVISKGRLAKLKGISVKIELLWLRIVEVTRDDDDLQFSVGVASADFSVSNFLESPECGCGFDCNNFHKNGAPNWLEILRAVTDVLEFYQEHNEVLLNIIHNSGLKDQASSSQVVTGPPVEQEPPDDIMQDSQDPNEDIAEPLNPMDDDT